MIANFTIASLLIILIRLQPGGLPDTGGDGDGFAISNTASYGLRNKFIRCIAHHNSDDGLDFWGGNETFAFGCVSHHNGSQEGNRNRAPFEGVFMGDGNGIKYGAGIANDTNALIVNCLSYNNRQAGFHSNNGGNSRTYNCTAYGNTGIKPSVGTPRSDRNFFIYDADAGASRINMIKNCMSYGGVSIAGSVYSNNSWDLSLSINDNDFLSVEEDSQNFMELAPASDAIGVGTNVGYGVNLGWARQPFEITIAK